MKLLIFLFPALAFAQDICGPEMLPVEKEAKINFLDVGAFVKFKKEITLPSFNGKKQIAKNLWITYPPGPNEGKISKGTLNKIDLVNALEDGYSLILRNSYPLTIGNQTIPTEIETVGDLQKQYGDILSFCKKITI